MRGGERRLRCTKQTSLCTCARANFRGLEPTTDGECEGDVEGEVDMDESGGGACTAVAIRKNYRYRMVGWMKGTKR